MRLFTPSDGPPWLQRFADSIIAAFKSIMDAPFRLWPGATTDLPSAADYTGGLAWNATVTRITYSDGAAWKEVQPYDATLAGFASLPGTLGLVEQTAADVFGIRLIGVANATDVLTRAGGDGRYAALGSGVLSFNTRTGAVTLTSADVTTALTYTPTSVVGLTGSQTVAAFKTGLGLVKADVGLGNVDNTSNATERAAVAVLTNKDLTSGTNTFPTLNQNTTGSAATLTTSRNFSIGGGGITAAAVGFNGSAAVALSASVDAAHITLARMADLAANSIIGNNTGSAATPIALTQAQVLTFLGGTTGTGSLARAASPTFTGTVSTSALSVGGELDVLGSVNARFQNTVGVPTTRTGVGIEVRGVDGIIQCFNGSTPAYAPFYLDGSDIHIRPGGTSAADFTTTGLAVTGSSNSTGDQLVTGTGKQGYGTGSGGAVTQATSKATGVTLNKTNGQITMNAAALAASTSVAFTLTNSTIAATDVVNVSIASGATSLAYVLVVQATAAGSCSIAIRNVSAGSLSEAVVINFAVLKAVTS